LTVLPTEAKCEQRLEAKHEIQNIDVAYHDYTIRRAGDLVTRLQENRFSVIFKDSTLASRAVFGLPYPLPGLKSP